jgi:hypothetical protein
MLHVVLAVLLAAGAGEGKEAKKDRGWARAPRRGRTIVLTDENMKRPHEIQTARGVVTRVEFPEAMTAPPQCSDCTTDVSKAGDALYVLQAAELSRYLTIWPGNSARRWAAAGERAIVPVQVRLAHGEVTLLLRRGEGGRVDRRPVVFVAPDRTVENDYLRIERAKLEGAVAQRIEQGVKRRFEEAFLKEHRCKRSRAIIHTQDIVLEVNEICVFGGEALAAGSKAEAPLLVLVFTVENRARAPFESGKLVVTKGTRVDEYDLGGPLESGEERTGVVVAKLKDGIRPYGRYEVTLHEGGGKGRVVTLSGVEI